MLSHEKVQYNESIFLPYFIAVLSSGLSISIVQSVFIIKSIFIILSVFLVYDITFKLCGNKNISFLACFLFAILPYSIMIQSLTVYSGDFFSVIFFTYAIFELHQSLQKSSPRLFFISLISLFLSYMIWNGGIFAPIFYGIILCLLLAKQGFKLNSKQIIHIALGLEAILYSWYFLLGPISQVSFSSDFYPTKLSILGYDILTFLTQQNILHYPFSPIIPNYIILAIIIPTGFLTLILPIIILIRTKIRWKGVNFMNENLFLILFLVLIFSIPLAIASERFNDLMIFSIPILAAVGAQFLYNDKRKWEFYIFILGIMVGCILIQAPLSNLFYGL